MFVDLHVHTDCSDGVYSPEEVTEKAARAGLSVISLTDHDTLAAYDGTHRLNPDIRIIPGIEMSSGSLGQGISFAVGKALALKRKKNPARVVVLAGDGEMQEGQNWEALMLGAKLGLANLTVIIDVNKLQLDGTVEQVLSSNDNLAEKLRAFNWDTVEVDGHDINALEKVFSNITVPDRPHAVVAHTVKGKGVSFMENEVSWHSGKLSKEQLLCAGKELNYTFNLPEEHI